MTESTAKSESAVGSVEGLTERCRQERGKVIEAPQGQAFTKPTTMDSSLRFPNQADVIHEEAVAFRRLSPGERLRVIADLMASGLALLEHSPRRDAARRLRDEAEAEWQRIQKELIARHCQSITNR
jgi:hypothetical protein